jgi:hypothetical protein
LKLRPSWRFGDRETGERFLYDRDPRFREEWEFNQGQREWLRDAVAIGLLGVTVFCALFGVVSRSGVGGNQVVMGGEPKDLSLHLGAELEKALVDALKRMQGQGPSGSGGRLAVGEAVGFLGRRCC